MHRRISIVSAVSLCLLVAAAAQAQPTKENVGAAAADAQLNINWEATAQLVLVPLTAAQLDAGAHEAQVRIHEKSQPLFFERVTFDVAPKAAGLQARVAPARGAPAPRGRPVRAHHPGQRAWRGARRAPGSDLSVEIR
ncbi:MAG: hypothetical protein AAFX50_09625, partial [Acidobacteriota bacterium]